MTPRSRWLILVAVALLGTAYVLPLWRVDLVAPQYPEGLGMLIRVNGVDGLKPHDLQSINGLNHYIGMKAIEPDAIPELKWMPWILGGLIAAGIGVAAAGRRRPLQVWAAALILLLAAGLWDYWRWGYSYGHDIDRDHAIIKIPGMTYQPPLIGSKKLLNFTATSWPASGGIALGLATILVAVAVVTTARAARRSPAPAREGGSGAAAAAAVVATLVLLTLPLRAQELLVGRGSRYADLAAALADARPGSTIRVGPGTYRGATVVVRVPRVRIIGEGWPVLDGEGVRGMLVLRADDVTVRGLEFTNTGVSQMEDRAALLVIEAARCLIAGNRFRAALFAVYLKGASACEVRENDIRGTGNGESTNGNGIHLWQSPGTRVIRNQVSGQRDGIYFEFTRAALAVGNVSEGNRRYGLHFMFSDSCRYEGNTFRANGAGVAVMYSKGVSIDGNGFLDAVGSGSYGLLLKEITDGTLTRNRFEGNSTGLHLEGASRLRIEANAFRRNGWAVRLMADAEDSRFTGNEFAGNTFDVATNSRTLRSEFTGNWWDTYRGYDLDHDGRGDVPFHPVRLFALVVEKHPEALLLLRSPAIAALDAAERAFPVLTPALVDPRPLMAVPR